MDEGQIKQWFAKLGINGAHKSRDWVNASCPFAPWKHRGGTDNSPGFGVTIRPGGKSTFHCLACKSTGAMHDLIAQLGRHRGRDYSDMVRECVLEDARRTFSWEAEEIEEETLTPLDNRAFGTLYGNAWKSARARAYLEGRGVGQYAVDVLGLGYDPEDFRITVPVRDRDGNLYGFSGRSILEPHAYPNKRYQRMKDYFGLPKRHLLLGEHLAQPGRPFFVIEGLFGFFNAVEQRFLDFCNPAALLGSALTDWKAARLEDWGERVFMAVDPDEGGDTCLWGAKNEEGEFRGGGAVDKLYQRVPLYLPVYPEGKTDPDQLTADDAREMIQLTPEYREPPKKKIDKRSVNV